MTEEALLAQIASRQGQMEELLLQWALQNSGSFHLEGLAVQESMLAEAFATLNPDVMEILDLSPMESVADNGSLATRPLGRLIRLRKRAHAPLRILFTGHYDTVFGKEHAFQEVTPDDLYFYGPGVADMKGGIVVMLESLRALETLPEKEHIGWEVILNPDEEIGSLGSAPYLEEGAKRNHFGLTFEPGMEDGSLAGARKGSGNFTLVVHGKAAHAGRNPDDGRNAITLLSHIISELAGLHRIRAGITLNPGKITGGGPVNVVPDHAQISFNCRVDTLEEQAFMEEKLRDIVTSYGQRDGYRLFLHGGFTRPPKPFNEAQKRLFDLIAEVGESLGLTLSHKPTGGCCDGNNLAFFGLPNMDTLGVLGGNIHSEKEYMLRESLTQRVQLVSLLLFRAAKEKWRW